MTSVLNRVRDCRRRRQRQGAVAEAADEPACGGAGPAQAAILVEETVRLNQAVAKLPDEQREVVLLRLKGNMTFREIARLQERSISTVLGRYRYGLERLRSVLNGEVER